MENLLAKRKRFLYPGLRTLYKKPVQLVSAKGSRVWDNESNEYLDAIGGIVTISAGHNHPRITQKLRKMLDENAIQHTSSLFLSEYMTDLCERLVGLTPDELDSCYVTNSGSEANEVAMLTARASTGSSMIVALRLSYHGGTQGTLALCGHNTWKFPQTPQVEVTHASAPYCYRCPYNLEKGSCALECAEDVKRSIETSTNGNIAGVIVEPIMGVGGFIDPPKEYHQRVLEIVHSYGGLYIADEVQTGAGRLGKSFFASVEQGLEPDIITTAKGLGNGAPIGAVITKKKYSQALASKIHFNTYGGDPFQSMQALETINIILEENLIDNANKRGLQLKESLLNLKNQFKFIGDVRGRGLMLGLELVEDKKYKTPSAKKTEALLDYSRDLGLLIGKGGLYGNVVRIAPPLCINEDEANELIDKLSSALVSVEKNKD